MVELIRFLAEEMVCHFIVFFLVVLMEEPAIIAARYGSVRKSSQDLMRIVVFGNGVCVT